MSFSKNNLVWLDLEMTGLNPDTDHILEIATVITNPKLEVLDEGPVFAIHQEQSQLDRMNTWNKEHHSISGLTKRVQKSSINEQVAEEKTLDFIKKYVAEKCSPLCGNTIYQDRHFLLRYMPKLNSYFHYRNLDVSTLKILAQIWAPKIASGITKVSKHLTLQDIRESIKELKYYRKHLFHE